MSDLKTQLGITRTQREVLDWIADRIAQEGESPTYQEIADGMGKSVSTVHSIVNQLVARGHLVKNRGVRSMALARQSPPPTEIL